VRSLDIGEAGGSPEEAGGAQSCRPAHSEDAMQAVKRVVFGLWSCVILVGVMAFPIAALVGAVVLVAKVFKWVFS